MSTMRTRLMTPGQMGDYHPYGSGSTPMTMPLTLVTVGGGGMTVEDMAPLYTGDVNAAPLPATSPGCWGQVRAAGRP